MRFYPSLKERLLTQHQALEGILADVPPQRLTARPQTDKWNIHDNIAHLTRYQIIFLERMQAILNGNEPHLSRYKAEDDPDFSEFQKMTIPELIARMKPAREKIVEWLNICSLDQLKKTGTHPRFGKLTLIEWTEFFLLHEAHHLYTIYQLAHDTSEIN